MKPNVITGAGNGIGKAAAFIMAQYGVNVICEDLHLETAEVTVKEAKKFGVKAVGIKCDATVEENMEIFVKQETEIMGGINILVNNAGGGGGGREKFDTLSLEYIEKIYKL